MNFLLLHINIHTTRMRIILLLIIHLFFLASCTSGYKLVKVDEGKQLAAEKVTGLFFERLKPELNLANPPKILFRSHPSELTTYDAKKNALYLTPYDELEDGKAFFDRWSKEMTAFSDGKALYNSFLFNWVLPQALAHSFQEDLSGRVPSRPWDEQMQANLLAFLFIKENDFFDLAESTLIELHRVIQKDLESLLPDEGTSLLELMEKREAIINFQRYWYLHSSNFLTASRVSAALDLQKMKQSMVRQRSK